MGPRFFKRGNASQAFSDTSFDVTLQWGRAFSSAEISLILDDADAKRLLQWGRAFSSAEIAKRLSPPIQFEIASMGPRFFKRGNSCKDK